MTSSFPRANRSIRNPSLEQVANRWDQRKLNPSGSRDQILIQQPFAPHVPKDTPHLVEGVPGADVVPTREVVDVTLEVLRAELVEGADIAPFEQGPERLDPVGVRLPPNVFPPPSAEPPPGSGSDGKPQTHWCRASPRAESDPGRSPGASLRSYSSTTGARIWWVDRSLAPATATLPTAPRPRSRFRLESGMFRRLPPRYASSISTGPENSPLASAKVARMRCPRYQADFWVIPRSRCSFMEETPFRLVVIR